MRLKHGEVHLIHAYPICAGDWAELCGARWRGPHLIIKRVGGIRVFSPWFDLLASVVLSLAHLDDGNRLVLKLCSLVRRLK